MWTRAELKRKARAGLKQYYWYGLLVCFVAQILGAEIGSGSFGGITVNLQFNNNREAVWTLWKSNAEHFFEMPQLYLGTFVLAATMFLVIALVMLCFRFFVSNVILAGKCRYFTISTLNRQNAGFEELFGCFKKGRYLNVVKVQFFRGLYEFLWSLLLIIPGIVKHYEYYMVPYLLAEFPDMEQQEVFRLSREMMAGNKFSTFVLELSFIGWDLLGILTCCIGTLFVSPYKEATYAELYLKLRESRMGISRSGGTHAPDADGAVYTQV